MNASKHRRCSEWIHRGACVLVGLIVGIYVVSAPLHASAVSMSEAQRKLFQEQLLYVDAESSQLCSGGTSLSGSNNEERIWNFLSDPTKNLKDFQVAGIMGNMMHESGLNPNAAQPSTERTAEKYVELGWDHQSGHAYGLVQWDPGSKLTDNANPLSKANDIDFQLEFLWNQLLGNKPVPENSQILEQIRSTKNITEAVLAFQGNTNAGGSYIGFERPADQSGTVDDRTAAAQMILEKYQGRTVSSTGNNSSTNCLSSSTSYSGLVETVLAFAWPEWHSPQFLERKPAYTQAVATADKNGIFRGGAVDGVPGIDCGGFVTLLMIYSGYEPRYNYGGKVSAGASSVTRGQEPWLKENWTRIYPKSTKDMQPGDVAANDNHTFVYVGKIDGFDSDTASASFSNPGNSMGRAPMAGKEQAADPDYRWYRKK